ncbi:hypothetical protein AB0J47_21530 [Nocardia sp. NPDC049737]
MTSHTGTCYVAINADTAAIPDLATLTECLAAGFATVLRLGGECAPQADATAEASRSTPV